MNMRRSRAAKIVSTLGPATSSEKRMRELVKAGADIFRLNFSHGDYEVHAENVDILRDLEKEFDRPIGIVMDLQGPKIRIGEFEGGSAELKDGKSFVLDMSDDLGNETGVSVPHPEIFKALSVGDELLLDDGNIRLKVTKKGRQNVETKIITGGKLSDHKGLNLPGVSLPISPLTKKDRKDLRFGLDLGVDWVALSFVQRPEDVAEARRLVAGRAGIMVKLEKPLAMENLDQIVELTDSVMVARGDLGVEAPPEDVPGLQKRIIECARRMGKPVVVATQMLESMVHAPRPTRAEASDVATAVFDGADAVMLSAETAVGEYPIEAVEIMDRIINKVEQDPHFRKILEAEVSMPEATDADAITAAARQVAETISAKAIATFTSTGSTTLRAARERPRVPILGMTPDLATARRLQLAWGVHPILTRDVKSFNDMLTRASSAALDQGFARKGQRLVVTAGVPFGTPGATNVLRIIWVE